MPNRTQECILLVSVTHGLTSQGIAVGNPSTDSATDNINIFNLFAGWQLIPQTLKAQLDKNGCGTRSNPINADSLTFTTNGERPFVPFGP
jgi:hypothetical protein